jgi:hypothetical protein
LATFFLVTRRLIDTNPRIQPLFVAKATRGATEYDLLTFDVPDTAAEAFTAPRSAHGHP